MKIILGTAALGGQPYAGKTVSRKEARAVIEKALVHKIAAFDTSPAYGDAEDILGEVAVGHGITIYSKHSSAATVLPSIRKLSRCTVKLMAHNLDPAILNSRDGWQRMSVWADGYSAYAADAGGEMFAWQIPLIKQVDCSIVSRRATEGDGYSFIARSIFLRGMLCDTSQTIVIDPVLSPAITAAKALADSLRLPLPALALHWAMQQPKITGIVIGPSSVAELDQIMAWSKLPCQDLGRLVNLIPSVPVDLRTWN